MLMKLADIGFTLCFAVFLYTISPWLLAAVAFAFVWAAEYIDERRRYDDK